MSHGTSCSIPRNSWILCISLTWWIEFLCASNSFKSLVVKTYRNKCGPNTESYHVHLDKLRRTCTCSCVGCSFCFFVVPVPNVTFFLFACPCVGFWSGFTFKSITLLDTAGVETFCANFACRIASIHCHLKSIDFAPSTIIFWLFFELISNKEIFLSLSLLSTGSSTDSVDTVVLLSMHKAASMLWTSVSVDHSNSAGLSSRADRRTK